MLTVAIKKIWMDATMATTYSNKRLENDTKFIGQKRMADEKFAWLKPRSEALCNKNVLAKSALPSDRVGGTLGCCALFPENLAFMFQQP